MHHQADAFGFLAHRCELPVDHRVVLDAARAHRQVDVIEPQIRPEKSIQSGSGTFARKAELGIQC